ncbi:MAG: cellulase family glycosylhydrolase [Bacteroidota bacterium]
MNPVLLFIFIVFFNLQGIGQGFLSVKGQQIVNEKGNNVILRGIGLGGWMLQEGYMLKVNKEAQQYRIRQRIDSLIGAGKTAEFYDAWLNNHTRKSDIDSLKSWGFNSVRLPMHYNLYTLPVEAEKTAGKNTWLKKGFEMTDSLLSWCRSNQIYLVLDLHAAPGGQGNDNNISDRDPSKPSLWQSEANQQKTIALWKKLAERYVNEPWIGAYDIINEPNWGFDDLANDKNGLKEQHNAPLKKLMIDITAAIREVDKKHIIIIEGNGWGNNYNGILPPWDNNMVLSFHKYWNYNNQSSIQHILDTRAQYNVPVWLGETGENSNVWFTEAIHLLEHNNIGWAWWPLKKIGINNPLEIKSNPDYEAVTGYFNGNGKKPSPETAYRGLMELAAHLTTEKNVAHRDVIDAMIRQPFSSQAIPFKTIILNGSARLPATDYDLGKNGQAYFDMDTADYHISNNGSRGGNRGWSYRNDGVDIRKDSAGTDYYISDMEKGEWLQYTIQVKEPGDYAMHLYLDAGKKGGRASVLVDGQVAGSSIEVRSDNPSFKWESFPMGNHRFSKGAHVIRVLVEEGGFNFKSIGFELEKGKREVEAER